MGSPPTACASRNNDDPRGRKRSPRGGPCSHRVVSLAWSCFPAVVGKHLAPRGLTPSGVQSGRRFLFVAREPRAGQVVSQPGQARRPGRLGPEYGHFGRRPAITISRVSPPKRGIAPARSSVWALVFERAQRPPQRPRRSRRPRSPRERSTEAWFSPALSAS